MTKMTELPSLDLERPALLLLEYSLSHKYSLVQVQVSKDYIATWWAMSLRWEERADRLVVRGRADGDCSEAGRLPS